MLSQQSFRAVTVMFALNGALYGAWASRIPTLTELHGLGHAELGLVLLALAGGAIVSFPIAGILSDRMGAIRLTKLLGVGYLVSFVALALAVLHSGIAVVVLCIVFFGVTHGAMDVAMNGWAAESEREINKPIMPIFHAMWSVGAGFGALSGVIALKMHLTIVEHFIVVAVITSASLLITRKSPDVVPVREAESDRPLLALPHGSLMLIGLIALGSAMGEGAMVDWSAIYLVKEALAEESTAAYGYLVFSVAMVVVRLAGGAVTAHFGPVNTVRISGLLALSGVVLCVLLPTVPTILMGFMLMGTGYAIVIPLAFTRAANDSRTPPGVALAGVATFSYGGMLLGPVIIGFIAELLNLRFALLTLALLALLSASLAENINADVSVKP